MDRIFTRLAADSLGDMTVRGYAAVYDQPSTRQADYPGTETVARGAFDGLLDGDVLALRDHNLAAVLGRTTSGTLRLSSDDYGLRFELDLPDTQLGRDTAVLVHRGDLNAMSFGFRPGQMERSAAGVIHTRIGYLRDVSVVSVPAYDGTSVRNAAQRSLRAQTAAIRARLLQERFNGNR